MNTLPEHRRVISGRTYSQPWSASSFDPITVYPSTHAWTSRLLGVAIGIGLALVIVSWIDWSLM